MKMGCVINDDDDMKITYIMLGGQEVENEEEVGVEHVIQSPDQIKSMIHHPITRHQTRDKTKKNSDKPY